MTNDKDLVTLEIPKIELKKIAYYLGRLVSLGFGAEEISAQIGKGIEDLCTEVANSNIDANEIILKANSINHKITVLREAWKRMVWISDNGSSGDLMPSYSSMRKIPKEVADLFKLSYDRGYFGMADYAELEAEDLEERLNEEGFY